MSVRVMSAVWDTDLVPSEKLVLLALADCANDEGHCWPAAATIAKKSGQGERTVRRAIRSLEKAGHLTQRQRSGTSAVYSIHPCQSGTPATVAPLPDRPETPATVAPKPLRTIKASEAKASKAKPRSKSSFVLPDDIPAEPWDGFEGMRNRIGKPMTDYARTLAINELRKLRDEVGWPPGQVLNHCTMNSYQGIYPPKRERQNGHSQQHHSDLGKSGLAYAMQGNLSDDRPM